MVTTQIELPMERIAALCREFEVRELSLFGSALRDDFGQESDIDFLVEFEPGARVGLIKLARLKFALEEALGRPVDVVPKRGLKPRLRDSVLSSARILYAA